MDRAIKVRVSHLTDPTDAIVNPGDLRQRLDQQVEADYRNLMPAQDYLLRFEVVPSQVAHWSRDTTP